VTSAISASDTTQRAQITTHLDHAVEAQLALDVGLLGDWVGGCGDAVGPRMLRDVLQDKDQDKRVMSPMTFRVWDH